LAFVSLDRLCIPFSALEEGVSAFEFSTANPGLRLGEGCHFPHEIKVEARVTVVGDDYLVEIQSESLGELICDRCGVEYQRSVRGEVRTLFTTRPIRAGDEEAEDVKALPPGAECIDISQDVLDALVLAVPSKRLCTEACLGLCSRCGADLNKEPCSCSEHDTDPRWDTLKGLKLKE